MITRSIEHNYEYKSPFGNLIVPEVEIGISETGRRSLPLAEVKRLSRKAALKFLTDNYNTALTNSEFTLSTKIVRAILVFLDVNQSEFGMLIGCQKAKVSKILNGEQNMSKSQSLLALERLAAELARPGLARKMLGDQESKIETPDDDTLNQLAKLRGVVPSAA
jgi:hypothetical protein